MNQIALQLHKISIYMNQIARQLHKIMNREKTEYFNNLIAESSAQSIAISRSAAKIRPEDLALFLGDTSKQTKSKRVKTQIAASSKREKNNRLDTNHLDNQTQKLQALKQLIQKEQQLLKKYQGQLMDLNMSKKLYELSKQQTDNTLQKLKNQKQIAMCIRKERQLTKIIDQLSKSRVQKIEKYERQQTSMKQKKELIVQRLKKLEEYKNKRQQILSAKSLPTIPKYKLMQKKFAIEEIKNQLDKNFKSRRLKELRYRNYLGLGSLDESRIHRINSEITRIKTNLKTQESLGGFSKKDLQQKKNQFLHELKQKRKVTVVQIDWAKELQVAILKDKEKNPLKYNFLKLKNLTQEQIYRDFKDYELNFDPKEIGNEYLQESKLNARAKPKKENGQPGSLNIAKDEQRQLYVNSKRKLPSIQQSANGSNRQNSWDLQDGRHNTDKRPFNYKQEVYKLLRNSQSKSKVVELLAQESDKKSKNMIHLQKQLRTQKEYKECMKIQKNIDSGYLQILKNKIVALKMQQ